MVKGSEVYNYDECYEKVGILLGRLRADETIDFLVPRVPEKPVMYVTTLICPPPGGYAGYGNSVRN
jgi:hypothetical protein